MGGLNCCCRWLFKIGPHIHGRKPLIPLSHPHTFHTIYTHSTYPVMTDTKFDVQIGSCTLTHTFCNPSSPYEKKER